MTEVPESIPTLEELRASLQERIARLQPALRELEQLEDVLVDLRRGVLPAPEALPPALLAGAVTKAEDGRVALLRRGRRGTVRGRDGRAPQGANKRLILAVVLGAPGIGAADLAAATGIEPAVVRATLRRLRQTGELEPLGEGVRVPTSPRSVSSAGGPLGDPLAPVP